MSLKEDIRQALAAQQALKDVERQKEVLYTTRSSAESNAERKSYEAECAGQIQKLEQFTNQSHLLLLLEEAKEELHGKFETERKHVDEYPNSTIVSPPAYTTDTFTLKWNIRYVKYSDHERVQATFLDDLSPFKRDEGDPFHVWQQITAVITSQGDITLGEKLTLDQWLKDPSLIQQHLVKAIVHPHEENDRPSTPSSGSRGLM